MAVTYTAPAYDEKKYRQGIDTSFYTNAVKNYTAQANKERASQIAEAQKNQQSALKQAYISKVQNQRNLENNLAQAGIRGGMTETANLNLSNQYGQARAAANSDYSNSVNQINQATDRNIFDYRSDMESRAEEYRQNQANARWQADREDSLNKYNSAAEYWNNYYLDFYSGYSKKEAQKSYKTAQENYKKATSDAERLRILQQIRGIKNRLGVIANK